MRYKVYELYEIYEYETYETEIQFLEYCHEKSYKLEEAEKLVENDDSFRLEFNNFYTDETASEFGGN